MEWTSLGISVKQMRLDVGGIAWARVGESSALFDKIKMKRTKGHLSPLRAPLGCFLSVSLDVFKPSSFPSLPVTVSCLSFPFLHQASTLQVRPREQEAEGPRAQVVLAASCSGVLGEERPEGPPVETGRFRQWWAHPGFSVHREESRDLGLPSRLVFGLLCQ